MTRNRPLLTDLVCGVVVSALGVAGLVESLRMPRLEARHADPFTLPGVTPGIVSLVLAVLGVALVLRALAGRAGGAPLPVLTWPAGSVGRMAFTLVSVVIYGVFLFGNVPFLIATALFVFAFTVGAELLNPERRLSLPVLLGGAAIMALAAAFVIEFVFVEIFLVRLPG